MIMDKERLGNFIKSIQYNLLPVRDQNSMGEGKNLFVEDWLTIEVSKYLYIGKYRYFKEPIPRRLEGNQSFDQKRVMEVAEEIVDYISILEKNPDKFNKLKIYNIGRGLSLLLALFVKTDFEKIACYDVNPKYEDLLRIFFGDVFEFSSNLSEFSKLYEGESYVIKSIGLPEYASPSWFKGAL